MRLKSWDAACFPVKLPKKGANSRVPHTVFLEKEGEANISVDRLTFAPPRVAVSIAEMVAENRHKSFYGWAVVVAIGARENNRQVIATPFTGNRYHADIVLPQSAVEYRDAQKQHAQELRDLSRWQSAQDAF